MRESVVGEGDRCVKPGCDQRAKDARPFCHEDWMQLSNATRRRISKLYSGSRRGHHRNPRQSQWKSVVDAAIVELVGLPLPEVRLPVDQASDGRVIVRDFKPEDPFQLDPAARDAIRELNKTRRKRRTYSKPGPELRDEIASRMARLSRAERKKIALESGLSATTINLAAHPEKDISMATALALKHALDGNRATIEQSSELAWLHYLESRLKAGKKYPTAEEAYSDGLRDGGDA